MSAARTISRRSFLKAAGLAGAPVVLASRTLGGVRRPPPSERITLGIIGLKKMGGAHVANLLGFREVQILAVCDVNTQTRTAAQERVHRQYAGAEQSGHYAGCEAYNEYERLLARPDIDAVVIATPDHWHGLITLAACRAGKDVYCEKPLSLTVREGQEMVAAVRRYGCVLQTGTQQRSSGEFRQACELVRNGYIGDVKRVHVEVGPVSQEVCLPEEPVPPGFDYDRWLGPAPRAPYNRLRVGSYYNDGWRRIRDYSGGKMTDWGAHHFDIVQWGLGTDESGPLEIIPPPPRVISEPMPEIIEGTGASPADPSWGLTFRYAGGIDVIKDHTNGILFVGTAGEIEVNRGHLRTRPASLRGRVLGPNELHLPRSPGHYQDWLRCIRTRQRPISDVASGARSAAVCHLGSLALWLGRALRWDPARQEIIGDEMASRWLGRPRRAPYCGVES